MIEKKDSSATTIPRGYWKCPICGALNDRAVDRVFCTNCHNQNPNATEEDIAAQKADDAADDARMAEEAHRQRMEKETRGEELTEEEEADERKYDRDKAKAQKEKDRRARLDALDD